jgi:hypothetical protein
VGIAPVDALKRAAILGAVIANNLLEMPVRLLLGLPL